MKASGLSAQHMSESSGLQAAAGWGPANWLPCKRSSHTAAKSIWFAQYRGAIHGVSSTAAAAVEPGAVLQRQFHGTLDCCRVPPCRAYFPEPAAMQCVQGSAGWSVADVVAANQVNGDCSATLVAALARHIRRSIKHHSSLRTSLMQDRIKLPHHVVPAETGRGQKGVAHFRDAYPISGFALKALIYQEAGWVTGRQA